MIEEIHVEVAIAIIVEEGCLAAESLEIEAVRCRLVAVMGDAAAVDALANQQLVVRRRKTFEAADLAYIEIQQAIIIDVYYRHAGGPAAVGGYLSIAGHVPEVKVSCIEIKFVISLVGCEKEVDLTVVVKVSCSDATSIIIVHVVKDAEVSSRVEGIAEIQAGAVVVEYGEHGGGGWCGW